MRKGSRFVTSHGNKRSDLSESFKGTKASLICATPPKSPLITAKNTRLPTFPMVTANKI